MQVSARQIRRSDVHIHANIDFSTAERNFNIFLDFRNTLAESLKIAYKNFIVDNFGTSTTERPSALPQKERPHGS